MITQSSLLTSSAAAGVVVHNGLFIRGTWHLRAPSVVIAHIALGFALWFFVPDDSANKHSWEHLATCASMYGCYLAALFTSMTIYRLYFHRLRHFPGPRLAAISKLWHVAHCLGARNYLVLDELRKKYGPFVRTGPNEITVFEPSAIDLFDIPKNKTQRTDWYEVLEPRTSVVFTRSEAEHAQRRRVWTQAMGPKAINTYLPRIVQQVETLSQLIADADGKPVFVNDVMSWFSFDSMGEFMFNESFGMMRSSKWHPAIVQQRGALALLAPIGHAIWVVRLGFAFAPWFGKIRDWFKMVAFCDESMESRMKLNTHNIDIAQWFIDDFHKRGATESLAARKNNLSGSVITAIIAGSDTTRPSLVNLWYTLARHPSHAERIHAELGGVDPRDAKALEDLPHLNAVINESMRLHPAAMTGGNRMTAPEGLRVGDTVIPGGTVVAAPKWSSHRLPEAFVDPDAFIPERWTTRPELIKDRRAFAPFGGKGYRECVGKQLALTEIRLVAGMLLRRFWVRFADGYDERVFEGDMLDQVTCQPGEVWICFEEREGKGVGAKVW